MRGRSTVKRQLYGGLLGLLALALSVPAALAAEKVTFALDWVPIGKHAGFFAALDQGYFKEAGLDVTFEKGEGSGDTVRKVAAGASDIGFADIPAQIIFAARNPDKPVKSLGVIHDKSMYVLFSLKHKGIQKPKDLEGRTLGGTPGDGSRVIFPALAAINGVDLKKVEWVNMPPAVSVPSLAAGKVDAIALYTPSLPMVRRAAKQQGYEVAMLLFSDFGVDVYSNGVFATLSMIEKRPHMVRGIVQGVMKGHQWAVENSKEAIDIFTRLYPASDRQIAIEMWEMNMDHLLTPTAAKEGIGYQDEGKMKYTRDVVTELFQLPRVVPLQQIYTNEYLPKLFPTRKRAAY